MTPVGRDRKIPINYQYEMMSAIYSILSKADGCCIHNGEVHYKYNE